VPPGSTVILLVSAVTAAVAARLLKRIDRTGRRAQLVMLLIWTAVALAGFALWMFASAKSAEYASH
jgi:heme/copper-type cytochrome/quinol oxidase subunit 3